MQLVGNLSAAPRAVEDVYERVVFEQYNLHLIDGERLRGEGVKWAWRRNQSYVTTSTQEGVR